MWEHIMLKLVTLVVMKREEIQSERLKTYPLITARTLFEIYAPTPLP